MNRPADRCPGVFATHAAADGHLARIRLSGGRIQPAQLEALAAAAEDYGDGHVEITGRANVQIRGIADEQVGAVADRLIESGLAGSRSHDRVRNLAVSPFSGRVGGSAELWRVADLLDTALLAWQRAPELSGRFWFGLDDGRGDVVQRAPDIVGVWTGEGTAIVVGGEDTGVVVDLDDLPETMLAVAHRFLQVRTDEWRIAQLPPATADLLTSLDGVALPPRMRSANAISGPAPAIRDGRDSIAPRVGWFAQDDERVLLGAVVPFGRLTSRQSRFAAAIGAPLIVTPEKELLIADLTEGVAETVVRVLAPLGFVFDANSPWARAGACTGSPGCVSSRADVRGLLADFLDGGGELDGPEHWVGCERQCGAPPGARVRVVGAPQ